MSRHNTLLNSQGLSQQQRLSRILKVNNVSLGNQNSLDLIKSCQRLSEVVNFESFLPTDNTQQKSLLGYLEYIERQLNNTGDLSLASPLNEAEEGQPLIGLDASNSALNNTNVQPHMQLFLTFLQLLKQSQTGFDQLPVSAESCSTR